MVATGVDPNKRGGPLVHRNGEDMGTTRVQHPSDLEKRIVTAGDVLENVLGDEEVDAPVVEGEIHDVLERLSGDTEERVPRAASA